MKLNFHGSNSLITVLSIVAIAIFIFGFVISQNPTTKPKTSNISLPKKCGVYYGDGEDITVCATCGNGICEEYENCVFSYVTKGDLVSADCGVLYCEEDCQDEQEFPTETDLPASLP